MALIMCPECKKEISDQARECPYCACPIGAKKKNFNKKILLSAVVIVIICVAGGIIFYNMYQTKKSQERIDNITKKIEALSKESVPSQENYDNIMKMYNDLSEKEKVNIKNADQLNKYKDVDLKLVKNLSERIDSIGDNTSFSDLIAIENEYKQLSKTEQKLIDISTVDDRKSLTEIEKAALSAVNNVKSVMKSKNDFKLYSVSVKNDLKKMKFYWVKVKYSGTNSWGASIDKTSFFPIDSEFKDPFFGLAAITGMDKYLDNSTNFDAYTDCKEEEFKIDVEKINYYMN